VQNKKIIILGIHNLWGEGGRGFKSGYEDCFCNQFFFFQETVKLFQDLFKIHDVDVVVSVKHLCDYFLVKFQLFLGQCLGLQMFVRFD
jgi:hypothetical protein